MTAVTHTAYADDIALLSRTHSGAQQLLTTLESRAAAGGLKLNFAKGKTEVLILRGRNVVPVESSILNAAGEAVPRTTKYKYLGSLVGSTWREDLRHRTRLAWAAVHKFHAIWFNPRISRDVKRKLVMALVVPVMSYAAFVYPLCNVTCQMTLHHTFVRILLQRSRDGLRFSSLVPSPTRTTRPVTADVPHIRCGATKPSHSHPLAAQHSLLTVVDVTAGRDISGTAPQELIVGRGIIFDRRIEFSLSVLADRLA